MRGPRPKPVEQRVLEGEPNPKRVPAPLLVAGRVVAGDLDEPPAHLPAEAKEFWRESIVRLVDVGIIDRVDIPVLEQLATQYARIRQAQRVIAEVGHFELGARGQVKEHPALKIEREATRTFLVLAEQYALTPVARTRLGLAELHRRTLQAEMGDALGAPKLKPVA